MYAQESCLAKGGANSCLGISRRTDGISSLTGAEIGRNLGSLRALGSPPDCSAVGGAAFSQSGPLRLAIPPSPPQSCSPLPVTRTEGLGWLGEPCMSTTLMSSAGTGSSQLY